MSLLKPEDLIKVVEETAIGSLVEQCKMMVILICDELIVICLMLPLVTPDDGWINSKF